ncbi:MAG: hypothetical protein MRZ79_25830 [Bacteroidia bacterium]|nr:hypothetical protein [Bacteroidia bacterium]
MQFLWKKSARSKGVVLTKGIIGSRGTRPNMKPIWRYGFSFEDQHGTLFEGESYSTELIFEKGDTVEVKFLISNPGFSKIKGSNRYTFSVGWIFFFCCAAPIFAIIFYAANGVWKSRLEQILKDFELSEGQKSKKNSKSSFTPSVISYSYEVQGKTLLRKFKRLNDEKSLGTDWILYQRTDPKQAILLGSIPDPIVKKILLKANKC